MTENLMQGGDNHFDENKNWLEEYVGEGKKFKTVEDLAKGKAYSDHYIPTLERQRDELREDFLKLQGEYGAAQKLQEVIAKIDSLQPLTSRENTLNSNEDDRAPAATFDPSTIESLVSSKIQEAEASRREQENYNLVKAKVSERFGNNFQTALKTQAQSLGLTDAEVDAMARKNPNLFFKTFDLNSPVSTESFQSPVTSSKRSDNFAPSSTNRKKSYYDDIRRKDPAKYYDPKTLVQMDKDVQALGWEAFNDVR